VWDSRRRWLRGLPCGRRGDLLAFTERVPDTHGVISNDPRAPWLRRVHPADSSTLPIYMVIFFVLGLVGFAAQGLADGLSDGREALVIASIVSGVFFTCFLILFAIYWTGYLLKGHALWQAERQAESDGPSTGQ